MIIMMAVHGTLSDRDQARASDPSLPDRQRRRPGAALTLVTVTVTAGGGTVTGSAWSESWSVALSPSHESH